MSTILYCKIYNTKNPPNIGGHYGVYLMIYCDILAVHCIISALSILS